MNLKTWHWVHRLAVLAGLLAGVTPGALAQVDDWYVAGARRLRPAVLYLSGSSAHPAAIGLRTNLGDWFAVGLEAGIDSRSGPTPFLSAQARVYTNPQALAGFAEAGLALDSQTPLSALLRAGLEYRSLDSGLNLALFGGLVQAWNAGSRLELGLELGWAF